MFKINFINSISYFHITIEYSEKNVDNIFPFISKKKNSELAVAVRKLAAAETLSHYTG